MPLQLCLQLPIISTEDSETFALGFRRENSASICIIVDAPIAPKGPTTRRRVLDDAEGFVVVGGVFC